jgi:multisubunit Na+/H+ antiporter MnhB subunit
VNIRDSQIMRTALTKLLPFALLYSIYLFSYSGVFPGGGFQAGVVIGTLIVVIEMVFERRLYTDMVFERIEFGGVLLLLMALIGGWIISGTPFGGLYGFQGSSLVFANIIIWILSFAIFLEVSGSMVLIFRIFLFPEKDISLLPYSREILSREVLDDMSHKAKTPRKAWIPWVTGILLMGALVYVYLVASPLEIISHSIQEHVDVATADYGIRNMVTTIYLGPRVFDTFLEVLVVVLTVFGVRAVGGSR